MAQTVEFPSNGATASGYLATPAEGAGGPAKVLLVGEALFLVGFRLFAQAVLFRLRHLRRFGCGRRHHRWHPNRLRQLGDAGADAPRHYALHQHRSHTSWDSSPGVLEIGPARSGQAGSPAEGGSEGPDKVTTDTLVSVAAC